MIKAESDKLFRISIVLLIMGTMVGLITMILFWDGPLASYSMYAELPTVLVVGTLLLSSLICMVIAYIKKPKSHHVLLND